MFLITKVTGDDSSDISACLLSINAETLTAIQKYGNVQAELSKAHECFSGVSFDISSFRGDLAGIEVFWLDTNSEWEDEFDVGADDSYVFITQEDFERLQTGANPEWQIGIERLVFDSYGDCFIEGSYRYAHGGEESAILPIAEIEAAILKEAEPEKAYA